MEDIVKKYAAERVVKKVVKGIVIAIICLPLFALFIWGVQYLWNWLIPSIMGWRAITYWETLGLLVLSKILFKGFSWSGGHGNKWNSHWKEKWDMKWKEKWETMSPEDREKFKQKMREKCGWMSPPESKRDEHPVA